MNNGIMVMSARPHALEGKSQMGHSKSSQRKIRLTALDFDDTRAKVWFYGENVPHQILMSYVIWLPSYNDSNFVSFCRHGVT